MSDTSPALPAPTVNAADDDGVLDLATARSGVSVTIPGYANFAAGDQVQLHWDGSTTADPFTVPTGADEQPISFTIPWETVQAAGNGAITVHYTITDRAGNASAPSQPVNLTITDQS
ncbi:hypothetical protein OG196_00220 [Kitasatospora purpeofusca]|uniref:hypothetical protein n=1 Tax=Kitasatospora purpeofusca TaxID=67352 RepID=UPI002E1689D3|nr:hypothetical protein OG196_00220 [Kitasatospora purpeofusca]